jgi:hypothetical protein
LLWPHCCTVPLLSLFSQSTCLSYRGSNGEIWWLGLDPMHVFKCLKPPHVGSSTIMQRLVKIFARLEMY